MRESQRHEPDSDLLSLRCYHQFELNSVRAGMVADAGDRRWPSRGCNAMGSTDPLVHSYICCSRLGSMEGVRLQTYRELVQQACDEDAARFSDHLQHQHPLGNERFRTAIEAQVGRRLTPGKGCRPRKQKSES